MPVVPTKQIVDAAFQGRYGVAAINVVNDLTMEAVLAAAERLSLAVLDYYRGGANDEITLRENRRAFDRLALR